MHDIGGSSSDSHSHPTEAYFKAKRTLFVFSSILLVLTVLGPSIINREYADFPLDLTEGGDGIIHVAFFLALYALVQFVIYWACQSAVVRHRGVYRTDFLLGATIGVVALSSYLIALISVHDLANRLTYFLEGRELGVGSLIQFLVFMGVALLTAGVSMLSYQTALNRRADQLEQRAALWAELSTGSWELLYHPVNGMRRTITFLPDGKLGEGASHDESRWRLNGLFLELLDANGQIHSRFARGQVPGQFVSTNDQDAHPTTIGQTITRPSGKSGPLA